MLNAEIEKFFEYARKRHAIYLKREAGEPWPWTDDPILREFRFTNVFRELDKTTQWFRQFVRDEMRAKPEILLATVLFRWFNRIETCRIIFFQQLLKLDYKNPQDGFTPWERFLNTGQTDLIRGALLSSIPEGPYVTGAYMIRSPTGLSKLDGVLKLCHDFRMNSEWGAVANNMLNGWGESETHTVEWFTNWLRRTPGQGPFLAYEVACDLIYTNLLCNAPDIMTWANLGPGARRGLNRLCVRMRENPNKIRRTWNLRIQEKDALAMMRELLRRSQDDAYWSQNWQTWDMRTVEHTLCEFDKYERVRLDEGRPRQIYRRAA